MFLPDSLLLDSPKNMIWCLVLIFLFGVNRADTDGEEYRLPSNIYNPSHYSVTLSVAEEVFDTNRFDGTLYITFALLLTTREIKIHVNPGLTLSSVKLTYLGGAEVGFLNSDFRPNSTTEILTLSVAESLSAGQTFLLAVIYTGALRTEDLYGFYKGEYTDDDNDKHYYAATHLEPTFARRLFPCFDEPSFKSVFDIRVTHPSKYSVRSITPILSSNLV